MSASRNASKVYLGEKPNIPSRGEINKSSTDPFSEEYLKENVEEQYKLYQNDVKEIYAAVMIAAEAAEKAAAEKAAAEAAKKAAEYKAEQEWKVRRQKNIEKIKAMFAAEAAEKAAAEKAAAEKAAAEAKKKLLIGYLIDTASSYLANDINKGKIWDELLIKLYDEAYTDIVLDLLNQTEDFKINSKIGENTVTLAIKHSQVKAVESVLLSHVKNHHQKLKQAATDYRATLKKDEESIAALADRENINTAINTLDRREDESLKSYQSSLKSASKIINSNIENIKTQSKENPSANRFLAVIKIIGSFFTNGVSRTLKEINHTKEIHQSILFFGTAKHNAILHYQTKINNKSDPSKARLKLKSQP